MIKKQLYLLAVLALFTGSAAGIYVGTAPGVKDLGTVERGETKQVKFYITTNIDRRFYLNPAFQRPQPSLFLERNNARYNFVPEKSSQEDISSWVRFSREQVPITPGDEKVIALEDGRFANAQGEVSFNLAVPKDAEPGYHAGAINMNPKLDSQGGGGAGVFTVGVTQFLFVFRVPGVVKRDMKILDVNAVRTGDDDARVDFLVKNNGTVTIRVSRAESQIYNQFGNLSGTVTTGGDYLNPGQTKVVQVNWQGPEVEEGQYRVRGKMNYLTGRSFIDKTVSLSDYVQIEPGDGGTEGEGGGDMPWWLVVMILVALGTLMYYVEIDPLWIAIIIGFMLASTVILTTGISNYWMAGLIILTSLIIYWWML